jgi:hypothetical protein
MVDEAVAGVEQSSEERGRMGEGKSGVDDGFLGDVRSSAKERPTHVGGDDWRPLAPSTLRAMSMATGNSCGAGDWETVPGGETETGR